MAASWERQALTLSEQGAQPGVVFVTGGTGYIGSRIISRLLWAGHTVVAGVRGSSLKRPGHTDHLKAFPGAGDRLILRPLDLQDPDSCLSALQGCSHCLHAASLVDVGPKNKARRLEMVAVAKQGTANLLEAVNRTSSVHKVVLMASISSILSSQAPAGHVFTEKDWDTYSTINDMTYNYCKVQQERVAEEMCRAQDRWTLAALHPSVVWGPADAARLYSDCASLYFPRLVCKGGMWPLMPPLTFSMVDVDDVALASCEALVRPEVTGRHILAGHTLSSLQVTDDISRFFPHLRRYMPLGTLPGWLVLLVLRIAGPIHGMNEHVMREMLKDLILDSSHAQRVFSLKFTPWEVTLRDMVAQMIHMGLVPLPPPPPSGPAGTSVAAAEPHGKID